MKKLIYTLIAACLLAFSNQAESGVNVTYEEFTLDNGLQVILHQDNTTPIVAVTVMYHVGSKDERPDRTGFAHFFEHLMFEGTPNIGRGEYFSLIQNAGGQVNAYTSFDKTFYFQTLPSNQLELALWMEADRMLQLKIDETGVETQREVIVEEKRQMYDNQPYGSILMETFARAYTVHPYRWVPIGEEQYIDEADLQEFMDFYEMYYVPNNAVLSIAGDIDKEEARRLIEKYYSDIPRGTVEIRRPDIVEPPRTEEVRDTVYDNIQLPAVVQAYHMPAQGTEDYYAISMLTTLLSEGRSSRLQRRLVEQEELALQVGAFPMSLEEPGLFLCFGITNMNVKPDVLERAMDEEIKRTQDELITEREFERLKNQVESRFVNQNASVRGIAESLANYMVFYGDANLINTEIERYRKVSREDIQRVAKEYLVPENRVVLYYLPKSQKPN